MKWMLVAMALGTTPVQTGLIYDTLDACYAAEDRMAGEYTRFYNGWVARNRDRAVPAFITQRLARGICTPHPGPANSTETRR
jgi:hypothetical protein